jgi:hypothetical protein
LFEAASYQLVTPALAYSLNGQQGVPSKAHDYLQGVFYLNSQRNRSLLDGFTEPLRALNAAGIEPVLLKGLASIVSGLYPDPAMRMLGDVDLLVGEHEGADAARALASVGFEPNVPEGADYREHHHLPPQRHRDTGVIVELHLRVVKRQWDASLDARSMRREARSIRLDGCSAFVPSPTHRVVHNIVHNQLSHSNYMKYRLDVRQMLELAAIGQRYATEIDWASARRAFGSTGQPRLFDDTLETASALFGVSIGGVSPRSAPGRLRALQRETEMSDVVWLLRRYVRNSRMNPASSLSALKPRAWRQMLSAVRREFRRG